MRLQRFQFVSVDADDDLSLSPKFPKISGKKPKISRKIGIFGNFATPKFPKISGKKLKKTEIFRQFKIFRKFCNTIWDTLIEKKFIFGQQHDF